FVLWTLTLIGGAIWAEQAWGRYWGWDPKEVGTFIAWVVYAAYLHARTTRGWAGRRAAFFVFVGYAVVLANFTVVNLFVTGKHSYSGL
ncbi:MAG TPA: cytochrome c biogenesis protein CcsA, partial [Cellulomonas sp.]